MIFSYKMSQHTRSVYTIYNVFYFVATLEYKHMLSATSSSLWYLVRVWWSSYLGVISLSHKGKLYLVHASSFAKKKFLKIKFSYPIVYKVERSFLRIKIHFYPQDKNVMGWRSVSEHWLPWQHLCPLAKVLVRAGYGGAFLQFQHLGGWARRIFANSRPAWATSPAWTA